MQVMCRMKKLIGGVKWAFSSGPSSRGSSSRFGNGSQYSRWSSSFVPSPHETGCSIRYPAHDDVPVATDGDDISIRTTAEMEKYESLLYWEFAQTRVYHVNLLQRVGLDEELLTILRPSIGENSTEGIGWLERWMDDFVTVQMEMQASIDPPACCMTFLVTSGLTLMLKSCKDLSLGEVPGAQVWVLTCLVSFSAFPVISSLVLPVGHTTVVAMIASKYCFH
jgi:hypothetical protein